MNIVLIGIMGSGKTTVGKKLSKIIGYNFVDMDKYISKSENKTIAKIFEEDGEEYFRNLEKKVSKTLGKLDNTVISTGGGVVLNAENMKNLKKNAIIIFLFRDINDIIKNVKTKNRPLLRDNPKKLYEIAKKRAPLYKKYADIAVSNFGYSKKTAFKIKKILEKRGYLYEDNDS